MPDTRKATVQALQDGLFTTAAVSVDVLRLDGIHPVISGNKWFKLNRYLQQARLENKTGILTFGGAWSNHLVATAYACRQAGLPAVGIVRGDAPAQLYASLQDVTDYGMKLQFVSREGFADMEQLTQLLQQQYPGYLIVPQGGQGEPGVAGAAEILSLLPHNHYTHLACAAGTGTMMAGLVRAALSHQQVIGINSLKMDAGDNSTEEFVRQYSNKKNYTLFHTYHFGGYARYTAPLLHFMNSLYQQHQLPTDFVYTGKLLYGITDLIKTGHFAPRSRLLVIHSGGLQGNRSLPKEALCF